jgi:Protein of unknown function (DUF4007)
MTKKEKLSFTGHDTFHCRTYWLKKGFDFVENGGTFNDEAVVDLGVGRNMVNGIRFWLKSFGMTDENDILQEKARLIFDNTEGCDPYCEDKATVYLLHYLLVTTRRASIYSLVFNRFRKERVEFTKAQLFDFLRKYCGQQGFTVQDSSLDRDIDVFLHNYKGSSRTKNIEENLSGILQELNFLQSVSKDMFKIENQERVDLPVLIVLYGIVTQLKGNVSINFQELLNGEDSVGSVFALSSNGLMLKIEELLALYPQDITFKDDGGIRLLQFKHTFSEIEILKEYYDTQSVSVG